MTRFITLLLYFVTSLAVQAQVSNAPAWRSNLVELTVGELRAVTNVVIGNDVKPSATNTDFKVWMTTNSYVSANGNSTNLWLVTLSPASTSSIAFATGATGTPLYVELDATLGATVASNEIAWATMPTGLLDGDDVGAGGDLSSVSNGVINVGLAATNAGLGVTQVGLAATNAGLGVTQVGLAATNAGLGVIQVGLAATNAGLGVIQVGVRASNAVHMAGVYSLAGSSDGTGAGSARVMMLTTSQVAYSTLFNIWAFVNTSNAAAANFYNELGLTAQVASNLPPTWIDAAKGTAGQGAISGNGFSRPGSLSFFVPSGMYFQVFCNAGSTLSLHNGWTNTFQTVKSVTP